MHLTNAAVELLKVPISPPLLTAAESSVRLTKIRFVMNFSNFKLVLNHPLFTLDTSHTN